MTGNEDKLTNRMSRRPAFVCRHNRAARGTLSAQIRAEHFIVGCLWIIVLAHPIHRSVIELNMLQALWCRANTHDSICPSHCDTSATHIAADMATLHPWLTELFFAHSSVVDQLFYPFFGGPRLCTFSVRFSMLNANKLQTYVVYLWFTNSSATLSTALFPLTERMYANDSLFQITG